MSQLIAPHGKEERLIPLLLGRGGAGSGTQSGRSL